MCGNPETILYVKGQSTGKSNSKSKSKSAGKKLRCNCKSCGSSYKIKSEHKIVKRMSRDISQSLDVSEFPKNK